MDVTTKEQVKYWKHWSKYASGLGIFPYLHKKQIPYAVQIVALEGFASRVQTGHYGFKRHVGVQTVQVTLRSIGKTCEMERGYNPTYRSQREYLYPLALQMEGFRREDPIPVPELAVPVAVAWWMAEFGRNAKSEAQRAMGDLGLIAFFFLL